MSVVLDEQTDHLTEEIERCRPWIQAALDVGGNTHNVEHIGDAIRDQRMQFWAAEDACIVTEILEFPNYKNIHVFLAGGSLERIMHMRPDIERFGKYVGCKHLTINGRKGWAKTLKDFGYVSDLQTVSKELGTIG